MLVKRPYITRGMCIRVVRDPVRVELPTDRKRARFWAEVGADHPQCLPGSEIQAMRIECFPETDSLYIDLAADGHPVGIDIDQASKHLDLCTLDLRRIPFAAEQVAG